MQNKILGHLKTVCKHKYYVGKYCFIAGIPVRGILHDLSKFSPTEFIESVKYYQGTRSPIDACKEVNGYSKAWLHHKGRNRHHYEYWTDNFDALANSDFKGEHYLKMPFKDAVELICDYLGAGQAYMGRNFTFEAEYEWWKNKISKPVAMHPHTLKFVNKVLFELKFHNSTKNILNKKILKSFYDLGDQY